jgi:hypothetical protein
MSYFPALRGGLSVAGLLLALCGRIGINRLEGVRGLFGLFWAILSAVFGLFGWLQGLAAGWSLGAICGDYSLNRYAPSWHTHKKITQSHKTVSKK